MLKSVLYYMVLATTAARFFDMLFLLSTDSTQLPAPVLVVSALMILYGIAVAVRRFISPVRLKQLRYFYMVQAAMVAFNLLYVSMFSPLLISTAETLLIGTFLDLIVAICVIYFCTRTIRISYARVFAKGVSNA